METGGGAGIVSVGAGTVCGWLPGGTGNPTARPRGRVPSCESLGNITPLSSASHSSASPKHGVNQCCLDTVIDKVEASSSEGPIRPAEERAMEHRTQMLAFA